MYAINGFRDLNINTTISESATIDGFIRNGTMHCGEDYHQSCDIQGSTSGTDDWRCDIDEDVTCNTGIANFVVDLNQTQKQCYNLFSLGTSFLTATECAQSAYETTECTSTFLMWSDLLNESRGCFCCISMDSLGTHTGWDIYQFYLDSNPPTNEPTNVPTYVPTAIPTDNPTSSPTTEPTSDPTNEPSDLPTKSPSDAPSKEPSLEPSLKPSMEPTEEPTTQPTNFPSDTPSSEPTLPKRVLPNFPTLATTSEVPESPFNHPDPVVVGDDYTVPENWCNQSKPVAIWISFDYEITAGGISQNQITSIITNITFNFVESQIPELFEPSHCQLDHEDMLQTGFFSAGVCYECTKRNDIEIIESVNASDYNLTALALAFEGIFHRETYRLTLWNESTEIEIITNPIDSNFNDMNITSTSSTTLDSIDVEVMNSLDSSMVIQLMSAGICAVIIFLMMVCCYCHRKYYRKKTNTDSEGQGEGDDTGNVSQHIVAANSANQSDQSQQNQDSENTIDSDFEIVDMAIPGLRDTDRGSVPVLRNISTPGRVPRVDGPKRTESAMSVIIGGSTEDALSVPHIVDANSGRAEGAEQEVTGGHHGDV